MLNAILAALKIGHNTGQVAAAGNLLLKNPPADIVLTASNLLTEPEYAPRMLGTYLLGRLSPQNSVALKLLESVSDDTNWRVQEMLAKAFDHYCKTIDYQHALPVIEQWLTAPHPNQKRAVVEGLRVWTKRPFFKQHPGVAIRLIGSNYDTGNDYLRRSIGNALRDVYKEHSQLVLAELSSWNSLHTNYPVIMKLVTKAVY